MSTTTVATIRFYDDEDDTMTALMRPVEFDHTLVQIGDGETRELSTLDSTDRQTVIDYLTAHPGEFAHGFQSRISDWTDEEVVERVGCDPASVVWRRVTSDFWNVEDLFHLARYYGISPADLYREEYPEEKAVQR